MVETIKKYKMKMILIIIISIVILFFFNFDVIKYHFSQLKKESYGNFGSFLSGTIGMFFSFFSVILLIVNLTQQRKHFSKNLIEERKRNELNRITDLVYKQVDIFCKSIETISYYLPNIHIPNENFIRHIKGFEAINNIGINLRKAAHQLSPDLYPTTDKNLVNKNFKIYFDEMYFAVKFLYNNIINLNLIFNNNELDATSKQELKEIFFNNINSYIFGNFDVLIDVLKIYKDKKKDDLDDLERIDQILELYIKINEFKNYNY